MAAIMTRRRSDIKEITKLMEECKNLGIPTLGPDVNESWEYFGANKKGEIRYGLAAIKNMGDTPAMAVIEERKNGPFKDIFDFAERVDSSRVNRRCYESLAYSGAFDGFGLQREQFFAPNAKGELFIDSLVRYGMLYQQESKNAGMSLFGAADVAIAHPPIPKAPRWATIERLNKERDYIGIYLSAHPLDDFKVVLTHLCNTHCSEMGRDADTAELAKRDEITFGGIVTKVVKRISQKTGKPFGFVTIEDYEGSGEIAFWSEDWAKYNGMLLENNTVFIRAKCVQRFRDSNVYNVVFQSVEYLYDVKDKEISKITISVNSSTFDETLANDLATVVEENPGEAQLYVLLRGEDKSENVLLHAKDHPVNVDKTLLEFIDEHADMEYRIE